MDYVLEHFSWHWFLVNATEQIRWRGNIGSGDGLMPRGIKPLSEPMITQIYVVIGRR